MRDDVAPRVTGLSSQYTRLVGWLVTFEGLLKNTISIFFYTNWLKHA